MNQALFYSHFEYFIMWIMLRKKVQSFKFYSCGHECTITAMTHIVSNIYIICASWNISLRCDEHTINIIICNALYVLAKHYKLHTTQKWLCVQKFVAKLQTRMKMIGEKHNRFQCKNVEIFCVLSIYTFYKVLT